MSDRKNVRIDEEALRKKMAADTQSYLLGEAVNPSEKEPELSGESESIQDSACIREVSSEQMKPAHPPEVPVSEIDSGKGAKKRKTQKTDFAELFLKERFVKNKKQIYISVEVFNMIRSYLKYMGDVSFIAYVDNILLRHIEENKEAIMEIFDRNVCKPNFNNL
jgi:hypothetical protein